MDRGAWWTTVHGFAKSQTRLTDSHTHTHTHTHTRFEESIGNTELDQKNKKVLTLCTSTT